MSNKQQRKAKQALKRRSGNPVSQCIPTIASSPEDPETYQCAACLEEVTLNDASTTCMEHVMCNDCLRLVFERSLSNMDEFPAMCCSGNNLHHKVYAHLLSPEVLEQYTLRAAQHFTPLRFRVFCSNSECSEFVSKRHFTSTQWFDIAICTKCDTYTCVGCKLEWHDEGHRCDEDSGNDMPDWLPKYSQDCRIKKCPRCKIFLEHKEACNHFSCSFCEHQFCFICLLPWNGQHEGCKLYGDPDEGYDEEGFERNDRGLHIMTGLDRNGKNR
ncbi:hypothetical protein DM02DRAFT_511621, partial [Periconia macrospinosa]